MAAPKGNRNALKHGFYSKSFTKDEIGDLQGIDLDTLEDEIKMQKVLIRRVFDYVSKETQLTHEQKMSALSTLSSANSTLANLLIKSKAFEQRDALSEALQNVLTDIQK